MERRFHFANESYELKPYDAKYGEEGFASDSLEKDYLQAAIIAIVMACLFFAFHILFCAGRCCCKGMCGGKKNSAVQHKRWQLQCLRIGIPLLGIVIFIGTVIVIDGSYDISIGVDRLWKGTDWLIEGLLEDADIVEDLLAGIDFHSEEIAGFRGEVLNVEATILDAKDVWRTIDGPRNGLTAGLAALCFCLFIVAGVGMWRASGSYAIIVVHFSLFLGIWVWVVAGLHLPMAQMLDDVCIEGDKQFFPERHDGITDSGSEQSQLKKVVPCLDDSVMSDFMLEISVQVDDVLTEIDNELGTNLTRLTPQCCDQVTFSDSLELLREELEAVSGDSSNVTTALDGLETLEILVQLLSCEFVEDLFGRVQRSLCFALVDGFANVGSGARTIGITLVFLVIFCIFGISRFHDLHKKNNEKDAEMSTMERE